MQPSNVYIYNLLCIQSSLKTDPCISSVVIPLFGIRVILGVRIIFFIVFSQISWWSGITITACAKLHVTPLVTAKNSLSSRSRAKPLPNTSPRSSANPRSTSRKWVWLPLSLSWFMLWSWQSSLTLNVFNVNYPERYHSLHLYYLLYSVRRKKTCVKKKRNTVNCAKCLPFIQSETF